MRTAADIEQDAAAWLIRVDREKTQAISRDLATWLDANPRHRASFIRLSAAWQRADALRKLARPGAPCDPDLLQTGRLP